MFEGLDEFGARLELLTAHVRCLHFDLVPVIEKRNVDGRDSWYVFIEEAGARKIFMREYATERSAKNMVERATAVIEAASRETEKYVKSSYLLDETGTRLIYANFSIAPKRHDVEASLCVPGALVDVIDFLGTPTVRMLGNLVSVADVIAYLGPKHERWLRDPVSVTPPKAIEMPPKRKPLISPAQLKRILSDWEKQRRR